MANEESKKKYAYLNQLSTEELESILRAGMLSDEDDSDIVDEILEVIVRREKTKKSKLLI